MTVKEFVENYNKRSEDKTKLMLVDSVITRKYAPILEKKVIMDAQINQCIMEVDGVKYIDNFLVGVNTVFAVIALYTNLDIKHGADDDTTLFDDYDLLTESKLFNIILAKIGEDEIAELMSVKQNVIDSFYDKQSVEAFVAKQVTRFSELAGTFANTGYGKLAEIMSDDKKVDGFVDKLKSILKIVK